MGIGNIHTVGAIVVGGSSAFNLDGVENLQIDPGTVQEILEAGGVVDPSWIGTQTVAPTITASINDIATALGQIALAGMGFPQTTVITTVDTYLTKMAERGTRAGATSHFRIRCNEGLVVPTRIRAAHGGHATMELVIHPTYDGTNRPFVYTDSLSLPHAPSVDELFTVGKVDINGAELNGVMDIDYDFGLEIEKLGSGGETDPTWIAIARRRPRIVVTTKEAPSLNTFGIDGTAQGGTASNVYFRKMTKYGTRVANATAEHIKVTMNVSQGQITCQPFTAGNNESFGGGVVLTPSVGAAAILTISTASAIT